MISFDPTKNNTLNFKLNILGSDIIPEVHLCIPVSENLVLDIIGEVNSENKAVFRINKDILKYVDEGIYDCKLEVVIGENYYVPWKDKIVLERELKIDAKLENIEEETKNKPEEKVNPTKVEVENIEENVSDPLDDYI